MKEIVFLSGKGGVGKSSLTAAVGHLLAENHTIVLADTDVDAPNLDLVLGAELENLRAAMVLQHPTRHLLIMISAVAAWSAWMSAGFLRLSEKMNR